MGELVFVGLGLHDEKGISLRGLHEAETADSIFIECYTSLMPKLSIKRLEQVVNKKVTVLERRHLEEENGEVVLSASRIGKAVLLVPGDPLVATTHIALRIEAEKSGVRTRVVHGASILSAIPGLSGLHSYKFGKSVTIPFADENPSETPYRVIAQNKDLELHTLCLLDIKMESGRFMTVNEGLDQLLKIEERLKKGACSKDSLAVGVARAGSEDAKVKAGLVKNLVSFDFGSPPHTLVFPGRLHFTEAEALVVLADCCEDEVKKVVR